MYMFMASPFDRLCKIRIFIPTFENPSSPTPLWSDVAFAYIRELHRYAAENELPNILVLSHGMIDVQPESRWHPYSAWMMGKTPNPAAPGEKPTLVNVIIGAGDMADNLFTPGCVNLLITGYGIPPYKLNWITDRAWDYDSILTMTTRHSKMIDDLHEKKRELAKIRLDLNQGEAGDRDLVERPLRMSIVASPNPSGIGTLVTTLKTALTLCAQETTHG
jgi:hypothetical protein